MIQKAKAELKLLFLTKTGWFSWFIANILTSLQWFVPFVWGFIFNDANILAISGAIFGFGMLPFVPLWLLNLIIARFINKNIFKVDYSSSIK